MFFISKFIVLIPAYQPDQKLERLIQILKKEKLDIIVVNDGSGVECQHTFDAISSDCTVLSHEINRGKGCALKTGYQYIQSHYEDDYIVVTMDCDGQHTMEDAKKLYEYNRNHLNTLVLGSRKLDQNVPFRSKIGNSITRGVFSLATGVPVYDTQTGLRSFSNVLMDKMISIPGERYEYEIQVLLQCAADSIPIHEIEIKTIYIDNNSSSHFHPIRDSFKIYREIFHFSLASIVCFFLDIGLYFLLLHWIFSVFANVISGIIGFVTFTIWKRKWNVFSATKIAISTGILFCFVQWLSISSGWGKILTELLYLLILYVLKRFLSKK